ncbi:hypothetical protein [Sphingobacterium siyangense]|uniref:hypothetical protein n=1 Tax=Sphingobacterium siyangense TaxID=459529 RepID=UPI003DA28218
MALFQLNVQSAPTAPASYSLVSGPPPTCSGDQRICTIEAADNGSGQPVIDSTVLTNMVKALNSHSNTGGINLKA